MERADIVRVLSENLTTVMEMRGTNAAEVARAAGINPTGVYDILKGKSRSPRLDTVAKIAAALNVPLSSLLDRAPNSDLRRELLQAFSELPEEERARLLAVARAFASAPSQS